LSQHLSFSEAQFAGVHDIVAVKDRLDLLQDRSGIAVLPIG
jgi:hypothetical protein